MNERVCVRRSRGKQEEGEEGVVGMLGEGSTTYRLSTHNHEGKGEKDPEIAIAQ